MTEPLKPCPFSGGKPSSRDLDLGRTFCEDHGCPIIFHSMSVDEWNRRVPALTQERLEAVKEVADSMMLLRGKHPG